MKKIIEKLKDHIAVLPTKYHGWYVSFNKEEAESILTALEAVKYMISVWDEVTGRTWRDHPDHVQQKFLIAEEALQRKEGE